MKRSSLLSAWLVGLSLTVGGVASAQDAPDDPPPAEPSETPPAPTTEEAAPPPASTQPAITIGVPTLANPTADTPQSAASQPNAKPKPRPFSGSALFIQNSMTTNTIFRGQTQYANPTVETAAFLLPRYAINSAWQIRGRLVVNYEWTNNDFNTYAHEPVLSDTTLSLWYRKIPSFHGVQTALAANLALPTSKNSRSRTLVVNPGLTAQFVRGFEHFFGGELTIIASTTYSHPIYTSRQPETNSPRPVPFQCLGGSGCSDLLSGLMNISDSLGYSLIVTPQWGKWNPAIAYIGNSSWAYRPSDAINPIDGTRIAPSSAQTNYRQTHFVAAWLDYNFAAWISGEVGFWNATSGIGADGQRTNLFFERYQDTRFYLGASIQLDNLAKLVEGSGEGQAGVVRAQNRKPPMFTF